jgi:hypothetical protein
VIDYQVSFTELATDSLQVFSSNVVGTTETVTGLSPGVTYKFAVKARNVVSLSEFSTTVNVLAAQIPDAPTDLANVPAVTTAT